MLNPSWLSFFPSILPSPFLPFIFPHLLAFLPPSPKTADRRPNDRPHIFLFLNFFSSFFSFHWRPTNQQKQYEEEERTKLAADRPTDRPTNRIFYPLVADRRTAGPNHPRENNPIDRRPLDRRTKKKIDIPIADRRRPSRRRTNASRKE